MLYFSAEAYDPLDPTGNITIKWDIMQWTSDGYVVSRLSQYQCLRKMRWQAQKLVLSECQVNLSHKLYAFEFCLALTEQQTTHYLCLLLISTKIVTSY
jgi:hypothetical protein